MTLEQQLSYAVLAMNALFAAAVWCAVAPSRISITALVIAAVIWPFSNGPLEGHTLLEINSTHGITVSDLLSIVGVLIAGAKIHEIRSRKK
ncbi:MAG: hypothetical protein ACXVX5_09980 [Mycobacterium sp.]